MIGKLPEQFFRDLGFGFRMLRRSPGFSILAIICLTVGIGANAAVVSWIEGILIRPILLLLTRRECLRSLVQHAE